MSDSAQWWTIGLLVAFMIIGLAMIFLSRGQKDSAPSTFDGNDTVAPAYVPVELLTSSSVIEPTSADVTLTRFLYAADAVADGIGNAAAKSAALSSIDVTAVEDAGMAAMCSVQVRAVPPKAGRPPRALVQQVLMLAAL